MIVDVENGKILARNPVTALGLRQRLFGLMGKRFDRLTYDALVFPNCRALHTCFMRMPIDVLFLNRENLATALYAHVAPWRLIHGSGYWAVELPAGALEAARCAVGHRINMNMELTGDALLLPKLQLDGALAIPELIRPVSAAEKTFQQPE